MSEPIDLEALPEDHWMRNVPLKDIRAQYHEIGSKLWRNISGCRVCTATFNQLAPHVWRLPGGGWRGFDDT